MSQKAVLMAVPLLLTVLAGCVSDDAIVLAFTQPDDDLEPAKDPQRLAARIATDTGRPTRLIWVPDANTAITALKGGQADAGFFDGAAAWFAWQRFGFVAIAADVNSDGRDHYVASAWVRADSDYDTMESLRGARSCHTGLLKSAGMFMPLGWLIGEGLVTVQGPDDISSIEPTIRSYFSSASIPSDGPYSGYDGALRCLSDGTGDVAFVKDTTPESYCRHDPASWCVEYRKVQDFGNVPSHPVMVRPDLDPDTSRALQMALVGLDADAEGQDILKEVLQTDRVVAVTTQGHLGDFGANLANVPGIQSYVDSQLQE